MPIKPIILLFLPFLFLVRLQAQERADLQGAVSYLHERLSAYKTAYPSNNLYLHLDKNRYAPQETIWFKAYILSDTATDNRVLYVRLADEYRNVVLWGQFPMYDIRAHGSLELPERLREGKYTLYAYTDRICGACDYLNCQYQPMYRPIKGEIYIYDKLKAAGHMVRVPALRAKIIYMGCGYYRDINYIKNITIPEAFPLPDYDQLKPEWEDHRSTIFWEPNLITDEEGKAVFSFFTSDTMGNFEVTVQGLDIHTLRPLMGKGRFTVK